ncbi:NADH-quinone oxidoreductase subunit C [Mucilaginibacter sp. RS28]|uniref:NADH-quinone oxidoreductase subunit C n=1 Tax=Mucilaginibacter straminoryzae TaxID=2932774 RepID=A0A9X1X411_9SPHI|nr:NADH-quinone oxidoreductase subunit C [Mucilaginibacter straminoryzae]MCJ8210772.1 NADH-quinone oxidoreductase subunit C [Mucilaginibacter straminoryzae]
MGKITNEELLQKLTAQFGENVQQVTEPYGLLTFHTTKQHIIEVLGWLKDHPELQFVFLTDITGIHYPEQELPLGVVYHLHSLVNNIRVRIKIFMSADDLDVPSATVLWNGANWMERETYDFFGFNFVGHPDLRRILNVDDMTVFPMRKEYPLEDPNRVDKKDYFFGR